MLGEIWKSRRAPAIFFASFSCSVTLNAGNGVFQMLVFGVRSYSKLPK
jgi:hypothetical protein